MDASVWLLVIGDRARPGVGRLLASIDRFNTEDLPLTFTASTADALEFAVSGAAEVVVVLDARLEFLRPFGRADFTLRDGTAYAFASEERERLVDGDDGEAAGRGAAWEELGVRDSRRLRGRGLSVWSAPVVTSWRDGWLSPRGWTFDDALALCADPDVWYLGWLLRDSPAVAIDEPIVAVIDTDARVLDYRARGITAVDLARAYIGVVTPLGTHGWERDERQAVLARQVSTATLTKALALRTTRKAPRVQRWLRLSR